MKNKNKKFFQVGIISVLFVCLLFGFSQLTQALSTYDKILDTDDPVDDPIDDPDEDTDDPVDDPTDNAVTVQNLSTSSLKQGESAIFKAKITNSTSSDFNVSSIVFKIPQTGPDKNICWPNITDSNKVVSKNSSQEYTCTWTPDVSGQVTIRLRVNYNDDYTVDKQYIITEADSDDPVDDPIDDPDEDTDDPVDDPIDDPDEDTDDPVDDPTDKPDDPTDKPADESMVFNVQRQEYKDSDGDGLDDLEESFRGTDANNPDTDGDGYSDYVELINNYDPLNPQPIKQNYQPTNYKKYRVTDLDTEKFLAVQLKNQLETILGKGNLKVSAQNWHTLVSAYIYGRYTAQEIANTILYGPGDVHPTIEAFVWRFSK